MSGLKIPQPRIPEISTYPGPPPPPPPVLVQPLPPPDKKTQFMTISDDRSAGSDLNSRVLHALSDRTGASRNVPMGMQMVKSQAQLGRDYEIQLMLLEQQNQKIKMAQEKHDTQLLARPKQEVKVRWVPGSSSTITGLGTAASASPTPAVNSVRRSEDEKFAPQNSEEVSPRAEWAYFQREKVEVNHDLSAIPDERFTGARDITEEIHGHCEDQVPGEPTESPLGEKVLHSADTDTIEQQIAFLQRELRSLESKRAKEAPTHYRILYRLGRAIYLDHPEWTINRRGIISRVPIENLALFIESNKTLLFIVFRDFDYDQDQHQLSRPRHIAESVYLVNEALTGALTTFIENDKRYAFFRKGLQDSRELDAPYLFFFHNRLIWTQILEGCSKEVRGYLDMFARYVLYEFGAEYTAADTAIGQGKISVEFVKYLFQPGDILVSKENEFCQGLEAMTWPQKLDIRRIPLPRGESDDEYTDAMLGMRGHDDGLKVPRVGLRKIEEPGVSTGYSQRRFSVTTFRWSFDGEFARRTDRSILTLSQNGCSTPLDSMEWNISDLNLFPLKFAPPRLVDQMARRGRMFWQCRKCCLVSYQEFGTEGQKEVEERFMVDLKTFRKLHPENRFFSTGSQAEPMPQEQMDRNEPPDGTFVYLVPVQTKGFNLRTKKWLDLNMDQVRPVAWNTKAFDSLVLDKDRQTKDLIKALVTKQISPNKATDVIAGKGNGLILLLHGGPGTGKTLTAEGVAEIAKKPLYRVTCGDVGTKAEDVEKYLESVLHLGKIWDCVVLLDEAEVFLERRSLEDLQRNALVSVFLRIIEYHEGILILTSNRVGTFDEAFRSRIQIAIHYPPLGPYQRLQIWRNFIERLESFKDGTVDIDDLNDHLGDLQKLKINGRQIRNAITTARQYADWKGETMNYGHLSTALAIAGKFDAYTEKLRGGLTDDDIAEEEGIR